MGNACIVADYGEHVTLSTSKLVRGRKAHVCGECHDLIAVGDLHEHVKGLCEGEWWDHRTCARCVNVRTDYFFSWVYGCLAADFEAEYGVDYRKGIPAHVTPCKRVDTKGD